MHHPFKAIFSINKTNLSAYLKKKTADIIRKSKKADLLSSNKNAVCCVRKVSYCVGIMSDGVRKVSYCVKIVSHGARKV